MIKPYYVASYIDILYFVSKEQTMYIVATD